MAADPNRDAIAHINQLEEQLQHGAKPTIIMVMGDDDYLCKRISDRINALMLAAKKELALEVLDAGETEAASIEHMLGALSLFAASKTVYLKDLQPKAPTHKPLVQAVVDWLKRVSVRPSSKDPTLVIRCKGVFASNTELFKLATAAGRVVAIPSLDTYNPGNPDRDPVYPWVQLLTEELGKRLELPAFQLLRQRVEGDLWSMKTELDKLAAACQDRKVITADDVKELVPESRTEVIFELIDAMVQRNRVKMLQLLGTFLDSGASVLVLTKLLHRQLRFMLQAYGCMHHEAQSVWFSGMRYDAFQQQLVPVLAHWAEEQGIERKRWFLSMHPFLMHRLFSQVEQFQLAELIRMLWSVEDVDLAVKTGAPDQIMNLERMFLSLAPSRRARH